MRYKVLVLLSSYNGERYIREQIESILSQIGVDVLLLIRDDGSVDRTCDVLDYYVRFKNVEIQKGENLGFVKSFSKLVEMAQKYYERVDYYAFSDQDDVWFPKKLLIGCEMLASKNQNIPLLFSSNSTLVDEKMNSLGDFHQKKPIRTIENVMIYPTEQGCSMLFNKKAVELYNLHQPSISYHDRWMCLICNFMGEMVYCQDSLLYYRIHSGNVIGKENNIINRILGDINYYIKNKNTNYPMVLEFYNSFAHLLNNNEALNVYIRYKHSLRNKAELFKKKYHISMSAWNRMKKIVLVLFNKL